MITLNFGGLIRKAELYSITLSKVQEKEGKCCQKSELVPFVPSCPVLSRTKKCAMGLFTEKKISKKNKGIFCHRISGPMMSGSRGCPVTECAVTECPIENPNVKGF